MVTPLATSLTVPLPPPIEANKSTQTTSWNEVTKRIINSYSTNYQQCNIKVLNIENEDVEKQSFNECNIDQLNLYGTPLCVLFDCCSIDEMNIYSKKMKKVKLSPEQNENLDRFFSSNSSLKK